MNKKLLTLLGLMLGLGVAFGALVTVISNVITYSFQSKVPFELVITSPYKCAGKTECNLIETVYGGNTVELGFSVKNHANNDLVGTYKIEIIPTNQTLDCNEISSVKLIEPEKEQDIKDTCVKTDGSVYFNTSETIAKESTVEKTLKITFNKALHEDNYTIAISILP